MNKKKSIIIGAILICSIILLTMGCQVSPIDKKFYGEKILGMSFVAADEKVTKEDILPIKEIGASWVSLMPYGFVRQNEHLLNYNLPRQWWGERDDGLEETAKLAHSMNLRVMVKPQVWFRRGEYTGAYLPPDSAKVQFRESFSQFVLHYAELSQKVEADLYCIGTEWHKFVDSDPEYWHELISKVRDIYSGPLTYAANWDEYKTVPFWRELDYIGVNAYFPISDKKYPNLEELSIGWQKWSQDLESTAHLHAKPILFTEYGYRSIVHTTEKPWESYTRPEVSIENQTIAYRALYNEFMEKSWFAGGFAWKWFHNHNERGGDENIGFTPQNKAVELVIKTYYKNSAK